MAGNFDSASAPLRGSDGRDFMAGGGVVGYTGYHVFTVIFISGEMVGYGDGWVLFMIGAFLGAGRCFLILLAALMAESFLVLILLAFGKIHRDGEIPFVPFLLLGMGVVVCF